MRVAERRELAPGVFLLTIEKLFGFTPGQTVALTTDLDLPPRPYSIASGVSDPGLEILFDVVPAGALTPRLARLSAGDVVLVSEPFGSFVDASGVDTSGTSVWIATGTGIAPFASMARSAPATGKTLIHGSRLLSGLYYRRALTEALGPSYLPCCTAEAEGSVFQGRVTALLESRELDLTARYLLCGSAEMVVDVRDLLIARGVHYSKVIAEVYF